MTIDWNDLTWNDLTMEQNDRKPLCLHGLDTDLLLITFVYIQIVQLRKTYLSLSEKTALEKSDHLARIRPQQLLSFHLKRLNGW